jgi:hypothetical protein
MEEVGEHFLEGVDQLVFFQEIPDADCFRAFGNVFLDKLAHGQVVDSGFWDVLDSHPSSHRDCPPAFLTGVEDGYVAL